MKSIPFEVEDNLKETTLHGDEYFPVAIYRQTYDINPSGKVILHWHEEFQFVLQETGGSTYTVADEDYELREGDILFINSSVLHMASPSSAQSSYICIDIHPRFLYGPGNDMFYREFILPVLTSTVTAILIDGNKEWHGICRDNLRAFIKIFEEQAFAYEMEAQNLITRVWLSILRNNSECMQKKHVLTSGEKERLGKLQRYIHDNYSNQISLDDIAAAGNISKSECCRFFKRTTGVSPITYLNNYRIVKSTKLLTGTDKSIVEIAEMSGFSSQSYYTEKFKKLMNCKPLEYRKRFPEMPQGKRVY